MHTSHAQARPIRLLDPAVADQIAAGEVVERPAAALKELLENSLDSGATRISVRVRGGGVELLEVSDDGSGIPAAELRLALARYATSKIESARDLNAIHSLGFRGEALAAISAVSRVRLTSRAEGEDMGREIVCEASRILDERPLSRTRGTTVTVENLFLNVPARRKFLKTPASERSHCLQIVFRLALNHPEIEFSLTSEDEAPVVFPRVNRAEDRVAQVFRTGFGASAKADELIRFERAKPGIRVHGFVLPMRLSAKHARNIFAFVNGRAVKDKVLTQAAIAAAREVSFSREYPQLALFLELDPEMVDVNVHPQKSEVRFREPSPFGFIYKALVEALASLRLPVALAPAAGVSAAGADFADISPDSPPPSSVYASAAFAPEARTSALPLELGTQFHAKLDSGELAALRFATEPEARDPSNGIRFLGALKDTYLVCQDSDGLLLVDQHAAHERVTYERLREIRFSPRPETTPLLIPIGLELGKERAELIESLAPLLSSLGLEVERFGPGQIRITELPVLLLDSNGAPRIPLASFLAGLADSLAADDAPEAVTDELKRILLDAVASESCHGSVRAGQSLAPSQAEALLAQMQTTDFAAHCPHGRPTSVRLGWAEIEKLFKRRL